MLLLSHLPPHPQTTEMSSQSSAEKFPTIAVLSIPGRSYACTGVQSTAPVCQTEKTIDGVKHTVESSEHCAGTFTACVIPPTGPISRGTVTFSNFDVVGLSIHQDANNCVWAHILLSNGEKWQCRIEYGRGLAPERIWS